MDLLLHFKVNEGDENNINIQEYKLYGDVIKTFGILDMKLDDISLKANCLNFE